MPLTEQNPDRGAGSFTAPLLLLVFAVLINYIDRGNLALAAPLLKTEWGFSASQLGILLSSFFWTYTALQFVIGRVVDRFDAGWVLALGFLTWSVATAATGLVGGFGLFLIMRMLLGVGESVVFPATSKILALNLAERSRGLANGALSAAMRWGSAAGTFGGGLLMARYGWRRTFIAIGLITLVWIPAWLIWKPTRTAGPAITVEKSPAYRTILRQRPFWGAALGHFSGNYLLYFMISWLPFYLVHERHLSMAAMARTAGLYYLVDAASSFLTGWVADLWIRSGASPTLARKTAMAVGFGIAAVALSCFSLAGPETYLLCLIAVGVGSGMANAGTFAFAQTLAGSRAAGSWVGLQNGVANLAGVIGPAITGLLVDRWDNFSAALAVAAAVAVGGGLSWTLLVERLEPVSWQAEAVPQPAIDAA